MPQKALFIETPRWGNFGHVFLVPSGGLSERECLELQGHYYKQPCGSDYISVSTDVRQRLDNGTVRDGTEFVVLTGIDANRCSNVGAVQDVLRGMFARVDGLIATHANNHFGRSIVIELPELDTWLQHPVLNAVPNATFDGGSQKMNNGKTARSANTDLPFFRRYWIWLLVICLLSIIGVGFVAFRKYIIRDSGGDKGVVVQNEFEIDRLAKEIKCAKIDVKNDLKNCGFDDADLNDISSQLVARSGYGKYFAVDNTKFAQFSSIENNLKILIGKDVMSESEGIIIIKNKVKAIRISIVNIISMKNKIISMKNKNNSYIDDGYNAKGYEQPINFLSKILNNTVVFNNKDFLLECLLSVDDLELLNTVINFSYIELGANRNAGFQRNLENFKKVDSPKSEPGTLTGDVLKCYSDLKKAVFGNDD